VKEHHGHLSPTPSEPQDICDPAELKLTVRGIIAATSTKTEAESFEAFDHLRRALWLNDLKGLNGRGVERFGKRMTFNSVWRPHELTEMPLDHLLINFKKALCSPEVAKYTWAGKFAITHETEMIPQFFIVTIRDTQVTYQEATFQYGEEKSVS
jgi:hypothetical protein